MSTHEPEELGPWKVVASRPVITDPFFRVRQDDVVLPSGATIDGYYVWEAPDIATVIPVTRDGQFVLCRQYRHAVGQVMLQFPAGSVDKDETPEAAARRELEEETGYRTDELEHLADLAMTPPKSTAWHHIYLARDVAPDGHKVDDPYEPIQVVLATADEVRTMIANGELQVGCSVAGALLALNRLIPHESFERD